MNARPGYNFITDAVMEAHLLTINLPHTLEHIPRIRIYHGGALAPWGRVCSETNAPQRAIEGVLPPAWHSQVCDLALRAWEPPRERPHFTFVVEYRLKSDRRVNALPLGCSEPLGWTSKLRTKGRSPILPCT